jgi:hypothetical protein
MSKIHRPLFRPKHELKESGRFATAKNYNLLPFQSNLKELEERIKMNE